MFTPDQPFQPYDVITVTISGNTIDSLGEALDGNGNGKPDGSPADDYTFWFRTGAISGVEEIPASPDIRMGVYPNPVSFETGNSITLRFALHRESAVVFEVRDVLGRIVMREEDIRPYPPGVNTKALRLAGIGRGLYYVNLRASGGLGSGAMVIVR
jgi:hypothetical protein